MDDEMNSYWKNGTWELVEPNQNMNPLSVKLIYCVKTKANGEIDRFKARLVIKGYEQMVQTYGVDYTEILYLVLQFDMIRLLLWIAAADNLEMNQFDCKTVFLDGNGFFKQKSRLSEETTGRL